MLIFALGGLAAVGMGWARGGRVGGIAELKFRAGVPLYAALLIQLGVGFVVPSLRFPAIALSYALVALWLGVNARRQRRPVGWGIGVLALGWLMNVLPILLNQGMPVSGHALERVGAPATLSVSEGHFFKHVPAGSDTALAVLGDVIPVPALRSVISVGDIAMVLGLVLLVVAAMGTRAPGRPPQVAPGSVASPVSSGR